MFTTTATLEVKCVSIFRVHNRYSTWNLHND